MGKVGKGIGIIILLIIGLFVFQNAQRPPMMDTHGAYLSLDLFFWGTHMKKPIGVSVLMAISFVLGILFHKIYSLIAQET